MSRYLEINNWVVCPFRFRNMDRRDCSVTETNIAGKNWKRKDINNMKCVLEGGCECPLLTKVEDV